MTVVDTATEVYAEGRGRRIARWLLIAFYAVAGVAHLVATDAMVRITPDWVPHPHAVVIATGLCELAGAIGLATPLEFQDGRWRRAAGWALALYAVCVFPANVKHAIHDLTTQTGLGWSYHGPRLPAQPLIVWWSLWASGAVTVRRRRPG